MSDAPGRVLWMLLGDEADNAREHLVCRDGTLPDDDRLGPGEIDDRRRHAPELAAVDDGRAPVADRLRHVFEPGGIRPPRKGRAPRHPPPRAPRPPPRGAREPRHNEPA